MRLLSLGEIVYNCFFCINIFAVRLIIAVSIKFSGSAMAQGMPYYYRMSFPNRLLNGGKMNQEPDAVAHPRQNK